jgi:hypothetical protein
MMATPQFETAVLAYLMNTGGACWKEDQEKKRELFLSEVKKAKATKGVPVPSRDKEDRHHTKCTWASDKAAALAKLKEKNRDRYNIARSKMELFTCPSLVTAFDSARQILEKDEPYKLTEKEYPVVGADAIEPGGADAGADDGFDGFF